MGYRFPRKSSFLEKELPHRPGNSRIKTRSCLRRDDPPIHPVSLAICRHGYGNKIIKERGQRGREGGVTLSTCFSARERSEWKRGTFSTQLRNRANPRPGERQLRLSAVLNYARVNRRRFAKRGPLILLASRIGARRRESVRETKREEALGVVTKSFREKGRPSVTPRARALSPGGEHAI